MKGQELTYRPGDTSGPASGDAVSLAPLAAARPSTVAKYRDAVRLYRDTRISITGIAAATGVERCALSAYLHTWHRDAVLARRSRARKIR